MSGGAGEFLKVIKPLRELRGLSWSAKALVSHISFRQRDRENVAIGQRRLAKELGMSLNTVGRAVRQAERAGLLRVVNAEAPVGSRQVYDASALDSLESASEVKALSTPTDHPQTREARLRPEGAGASDSKAPDRLQAEGTSASDSAAGQEVFKKNTLKKGEEAADLAPTDENPRSAATPATEFFLSLPDCPISNNGHGQGGIRGNDNGTAVERIIDQAFPGGATAKQRSATMNAIAEALRQGATYPLLAHAVTSPKATERTPWGRIEEAGRKAAELLRQARTECGFKGTSLEDFLAYVPQGDAVGPRAAEWLGKEQKKWRKQTTEWPTGKGGKVAT